MNEDHIKSLMGIPLLHGYTVHGVKRLLESGAVRKHAAGEVLFNEGEKPEDVLLVIMGRLQIYVNRQGLDIMVNHAGPGDIVGELAVLCGRPRTASVRAAEESAALHWDRKAFHEVLLDDSTLSERVFGRALRTLVDREMALVEEVLKKQPPKRVAS